MIANHTQFIEAVEKKKKVRVRFYSLADDGVLDRVCAPLDYGLGNEPGTGLHRYWLWDYQSSEISHILGLLPQQVLDLKVLGEDFNPSDFGDPGWTWALSRVWAPALPVLPANKP